MLACGAQVADPGSGRLGGGAAAEVLEHRAASGLRSDKAVEALHHRLDVLLKVVGEHGVDRE